MLLEFEKPIAELESKLEDMKHLAGDSDEKVKDAIKALEKKITDLKQSSQLNEFLNHWKNKSLTKILSDIF